MSPDLGGCQGASTPPPVEEGAPLWTVTFGDMMSLLLTFFILMFSMSELKVERFMLASQSMRQAMGGTATEAVDGPMGLMPDPVDPELELQNPGAAEGAVQQADGASDEVDEIEALVDAYSTMIFSRLEAFVAERGLEDLVTVTKDGQGIYLRMQTAALFTSGSATIQPEGRDALAELSDITGSTSLRVVVSGHADNQPVSGGPFASNWELSAARAAGVARGMVAHGQDPLFVRVESFGAYRPIADNATPEGRAMNRRVELFYSRADILEVVLSWVRLAEVHVDGASPEEGAPAADPAR